MNTASSTSCVTRIAVKPLRWHSSSTSVCNSMRVSASTALKGSSSSRTSGSAAERARNGDALLHAAGQLPGIFVFEAGEAHLRDEAAAGLA